MSYLQETIDAIPVYDDPIGVLVSGGADSALLLYFLMSKYKSKIHIFTVAVGNDEQVDVKASIDVVNMCVKLTNNLNVEHHISYEPKEPGKQKKLRRLARQYLNDGDICAIFYGLTKTPPTEVHTSWDCDVINEVTAIRDPEVKRVTRFTNETVKPWTNLDKRDLAQIYQDYDLLESLFPLTRSCVLPVENAMLHCGDCWWCKEREWAFGKLK